MKAENISNANQGFNCNLNPFLGEKWIFKNFHLNFNTNFFSKFETFQKFSNTTHQSFFFLIILKTKNDNYIQVWHPQLWSTCSCKPLKLIRADTSPPGYFRITTIIELRFGWLLNKIYEKILFENFSFSSLKLKWKFLKFDFVKKNHAKLHFLIAI